MSKLDSYSFGSITFRGCSAQHHLEILHSVLCKVCCIDVPEYDVHRSLREYFIENSDAHDIIGDLRDLLNVSLH